MKLKQDIRSITYMKTKAADLLEQLNRERRPVIITQKGAARAVLMDPESYEKLQETIAMLQLVLQGEKDVRAGRVTPQKQVFDKLERKLKARARTS